MPKTIKLAHNLVLPARAITESIAIMGRKGSGKTYTAGLLFEQMHKAGAQCVVLDPVGNFWGLRLSANGNRRGLDIPVFGGEHGDIPITPESGALIAQVIIERRLSCVVDLMNFRKGQRKKFVTAFAEELFNLKKRQRAPLHLFLEEARKFIPQKPFGLDENRMIGAFEDIVRLGRNYGLGASLIDQRPQSVNKEVLSQTELLIVHQLTGTHERKVIKEWVQDKTTEGADALKKLAELRPGEAFFWSPGLMRTFAKIKVLKKSTYDASSTPELDGESDGVGTKPLSDKDMAKLEKSMVSVVEKVAMDDPKKLRAKLQKALGAVKRLEAELENRPAEVERVEVPVISQEAVTKIGAAVDEIREMLHPIGDKMGEMTQSILAIKIAAGAPAPKTFFLNEKHTTRSKKSVARARPVKSNGVNPKNSRVVPEGDLTGPEQRIVDAIAWLEGIGVEKPVVTAVAFLANYKPGGGSFNNARGKLRSKGLLEYATGKRLFLTATGRAIAEPPGEPLDNAALHAHVLAKLGGPEQRILQPLLDIHPDSMTTMELAAAAGYESGGGSFNNARGRLRTLGLADYPEPGKVRATDVLFLD